MPPSRRSLRPGLVALFTALAFSTPGLGGTAGAQTNIGFQLDRYEPTTAGEWFFAVEHPWYSKTRYLAVGLTLDYAHDPLLTVDAQGKPLPSSLSIQHQLVGHVDVAFAFLNRFNLSASLPVNLLEHGTSDAEDVPLSGVAVGDLRVGVAIRLVGQPDDAISLHVRGDLWVPLGSYGNTVGDDSVRGGGKLILAGLYDDWLRWSLNTGFVARSPATLNTTSVGGVSQPGNELQLGAALGYVTDDRRFNIGPELTFGTAVTPSQGQAFGKGNSSLELLLGAQYSIADHVLVGLAAGAGFLTEAGTPDLRLLLRVAYAAQPARDRDSDGIADRDDACPDERGKRQDDPKRNGCPIRDRDGDGFVDDVDQCVDLAAGPRADAARPGCPEKDSDGDGVLDADDRCPDQPAGGHPEADAARRGCPLLDRDGDAISDDTDLCPDAPQGERPDPKRPGCPALDGDGDGVLDADDACPAVASGALPDKTAGRVGCPAPDSDGDGVQDPADACPGEAGAADLEAAKNGCPGQARVAGGRILTVEPVLFMPAKATVTARSLPMLDAVARLLGAMPAIKKVAVVVVGNADPVGLVVSGKRAERVKAYLVGKGVDPLRLEALAEGAAPVSPTTTPAAPAGRHARGRRARKTGKPSAAVKSAGPSVELRVVDPAPAAPVAAPPA